MSFAGSGGTSLLMVRHSTHYAYSDPVLAAHSEVRKLPVPTRLQRVFTSKLEVDPPAALRFHDDYFGNRVCHFDVLEPHDTLSIAGESVVETRDDACCGPEPADDPRPWQERFAEYLHASPAVPPLEGYASVAHGAAVGIAPQAFLQSLRELARAFVERFRYDPDATHVHSTPAELFEKGGGVCQDFAHGLIGVLRRAGVPARYTSGYLYSERHDGVDDERGADASHAWVQAWHPDLGWVGVDPTNDKLVNWQYVRVAVGRDYTDVQPLRGTFLGEATQELSVSVSVERLDRAR